ncbi:MAG TPA: response regulator [Parafilimonas sp.]|nr:response regulator [Parafilimonas sp.]HVZ95232.1 response regulator [Chitinophagaceae bacterium]
MNKEGCIIVIEDDLDDQFLIQESFKELNYPNEIIFFNDGQSALAFLANGNKNPFLILSDINLPKLNGFQLRLKLKENADLHLKCIPYLFFTTALNHQAVIDAYSTSVQGFFTKPTSFIELKEQIKIIMEYWKHCSAPNYFLQ